MSFYESAPKDSFVLKNTSECVLEDLVFNVDLSKTAGRLIFDTTSSGAGVEVFQPFEVVNGSLTLVSSAKVNDGDTNLKIKIKRIAPTDSVSFTIDVDDTLAKSALGNIRVADAEIAGMDVEPGAVIGAMAKAVVTIQVINLTYMYVTIKGPQGNYMTIDVEDADLIKKLHVGQVVILTYGEAIAITLTKVE